MVLLAKSATVKQKYVRLELAVCDSIKVFRVKI